MYNVIQVIHKHYLLHIINCYNVGHSVHTGVPHHIRHVIHVPGVEGLPRFQLGQGVH